MIIHKNDGYYVISEKSGKNLGGPYKTKEEAAKRLQQIHYFKHLNKSANFTFGLNSFFKEASEKSLNPMDYIDPIEMKIRSKLGKDIKVLKYEYQKDELEKNKKLQEEELKLIESLPPEKKKLIIKEILEKYSSANTRDPYFIALEEAAKQPGGLTVTVTKEFLDKLENIKKQERGKTFVGTSSYGPKIMTGENGYLKYYNGEFKQK